jgi:hypothetical protein
MSYPMQGDNMEGCLHPSKSPRTSILISQACGSRDMHIVQCLEYEHFNKWKITIGAHTKSGKEYNFEDFSLCSLNIITMQNYYLFV